MNEKDNQKIQITKIYGGNSDNEWENPLEATKVISSSNPDNIIEISENNKNSSETEQAIDPYKNVILGMCLGDTISLKDKTYKIIDLISKTTTSEAIVYRIKTLEGVDLALKLYYEFASHNLEPNSEALVRIIQIDSPYILKLHDYGLGKDKYLGRYCYEINQFAAGGMLSINIETVKPEYLKDVIIRHIFYGIKALHDHKIIHCDLKIENIMFLDAEHRQVVIGDYGSAKTFKLEEKQQIKAMTTVRGTNFYLAPEHALGIVSTASDYYTLGMIMLALLYPDKVNMREYRLMIVRQTSRKEILDFHPRWGRFNSLIAGLTLVDRELRWGRTQVEQWLAGVEVPVLYRSPSEKSNSIKIGDSTINTMYGLTTLIKTRTDWFELLFGNDLTYNSLLLPWFAEIKNIEFVQLLDELFKYYLNFGVEYAKFFLSQFLTASNEIQINEHKLVFNAEQNLSDFTTEAIAIIEESPLYDLSQMKFSLFQIEYMLRFTTSSSLEREGKNLLSRIKAPLGIIEIEEPGLHFCSLFNCYDLAAFVELFYGFIQDRVFRTLEGKYISDIKPIALYAAQGYNYSKPMVKHELKSFVNKYHPESKFATTLSELLIESFAQEVNYSLEVMLIRRCRPFEYEILYNISFDLKELLGRYNIINLGITSSVSNKKTIAKRKIYDTNQTLERVILKQIQSNNPQRQIVFTQEIKDKIQREFRRINCGKDDYGQFSNRKPILYTLCFIALLLIVGLFVNHYFVVRFLPVFALLALLCASVTRKISYWYYVMDKCLLSCFLGILSTILFVWGIGGCFFSQNYSYQTLKYKEGIYIAKAYATNHSLLKPVEIKIPTGKLTFRGKYDGRSAHLNYVQLTGNHQGASITSHAKVILMSRDSTWSAQQILSSKQLESFDKYFHAATYLKPHSVINIPQRGLVNTAFTFRFNNTIPTSGFGVRYRNLAITIKPDRMEIRQFYKGTFSLSDKYSVLNSANFTQANSSTQRTNKTPKFETFIVKIPLSFDSSSVFDNSNNQFVSNPLAESIESVIKVPTANSEQSVIRQDTDHAKAGVVDEYFCDIVYPYYTLFSEPMDLKTGYHKIVVTTLHNACIVQIDHRIYSIGYINTDIFNQPAPWLYCFVQPQTSVEISNLEVESGRVICNPTWKNIDDRIYGKTITKTHLNRFPILKNQNQLKQELYATQDSYLTTPHVSNEYQTFGISTIMPRVISFYKQIVEFVNPKHEIPQNCKVEILFAKQGSYFVRFRNQTGYLTINDLAIIPQ